MLAKLHRLILALALVSITALGQAPNAPTLTSCVDCVPLIAASIDGPTLFFQCFHLELLPFLAACPGPVYLPAGATSTNPVPLTLYVAIRGRGLRVVMPWGTPQCSTPCDWDNGFQAGGYAIASATYGPINGAPGFYSVTQLWTGQPGPIEF